MYIPGRSRTGWRPLRIEMSLAAYATRGFLIEGLVDRCARTAPKIAQKSWSEGVFGLLILPDRAALNRSPRGVPRRPSRTMHDAGPEHGLGPLDEALFEVPQLGRPDRAVDRRPCTRRRAPSGRSRCAATAVPTSSSQSPTTSRDDVGFGQHRGSRPTAASASLSGTGSRIARTPAASPRAPR